MDFLSDEAVFLKKTIILTKVHAKKLSFLKLFTGKMAEVFAASSTRSASGLSKTDRSSCPCFGNKKIPTAIAIGISGGDTQI